jgi:CMP/dCMP kinase
MEKKSILSLHGFASTGVTGTSQILEEYFPDHTFHSTGAMARKIAADNHMKIAEYNKYARENNIPYDTLLDDSLKKINESDGKWIVDSRLGYLFIPSSFKVYLKVDPHTAADRRLAQLQHDDPEGNKDLTVEEVFDDLARRDSNDLNTYLQMYNTNCSDESHYDLVVDTSKLTRHAVASHIMMEYLRWLRIHDLLRHSKKN